jgi:TolB protein
MMEEAEVITVVKFDPATATGPTWKAKVVHEGPWSRTTEFKGKSGKELGDEITVKGDPKAFAPIEMPEVDEKKGFGFRRGGKENEFLVFLKSAGEEGVYRCLDANPGGFCKYHALGAGATDHRTLYVGMVNGRLAIEGGPGYQNHPMSGPTIMLNALRGLRQGAWGRGGGASLTAKAAGGAAVDLELKVGGAGCVPGQLVLAAPALWAEVETPEGDAVLLSPQDYLLPGKESPYVDIEKTKLPGGVVTGRAELPTGPVPEGAELTWARANHHKPLLGSLPAGEHTVRLLCVINNLGNADIRHAVLLISNPVKVQGKAGGAAPADLAKLKDAVAQTAGTAQGSATPAVARGALDKAGLKGEIWFDSNRDGSWDVFVMNADGSNIRNVTNTKDKDEFEPRPSPDGKRVVYVVGKLGNGGVWGGRWNPGQVWVADRDGGNAKMLAEKGSRPAWGPDGKAIAYSGEVAGKGSFVVQNVETGKIGEPLKKVGNWFRDIAGGEIATETRRVAFGGKLWTQVDSALYAADLDENYEFKSFKPVHTAYRGCTPRWAADGQRIHFAHHDPTHGGGIILWTVNADGTGARRFETPARKAWDGYSPFCESPDGTMFAYLGGAGISVQRISDGADVSLTEKKDKVQYGGIRWHRGG